MIIDIFSCLPNVVLGQGVSTRRLEVLVEKLKVTITRVKGSSTKNFTGTKPERPKGYKRK